jgi:hypothetical protein
MRKQIVLLTICLLFICKSECLAWGNKKTHPALTAKAIEVDDVVDNYLKNQLDISQGLQTQLTWSFPSEIEKRLEKGEAEPSKTTRSALEWIKVGSIIEDEDGRKWPHRSRHHFHDPTRNAGLDNQSDHPNWENYACTWTGFDLTGESALHWAAVGTAEKEPTTNDHYWGKAREEFYNALTESDESVREESLAKTFLNLGHVLHLIEDSGVPAHARNDFIEAHYRGIKSPLNFKNNPLEKHVENEIKDLGEIPARWLSTQQAKIFSKLSDYWDVNDYNGVYVGTSPLTTWGLSEQTNYQFLSKSTIFRANDGTKYYFPHPDPCNVSGYIKPGVYL